MPESSRIGAYSPPGIERGRRSPWESRGRRHRRQGGRRRRSQGIAQFQRGIFFSEAFFRGVLCNALVCLSMWLAMAARDVTGKILAIVFPISAFVAIGFEHSVANMFFFPHALIGSLDAAAGGRHHRRSFRGEPRAGDFGKHRRRQRVRGAHLLRDLSARAEPRRGSLVSIWVLTYARTACGNPGC